MPPDPDKKPWELIDDPKPPVESSGAKPWELIGPRPADKPYTLGEALGSAGDKIVKGVTEGIPAAYEEVVKDPAAAIDKASTAASGAVDSSLKMIYQLLGYPANMAQKAIAEKLGYKDFAEAAQRQMQGPQEMGKHIMGYADWQETKRRIAEEPGTVALDAMSLVPAFKGAAKLPGQTVRKVMAPSSLAATMTWAELETGSSSAAP